MAAIHLAFDIDPDVYPELHAMLSAMGSDAARGERFRQLAATGLVWETVRVRGYPVSVALAVLEDEARAQEAMATAPVAADDGGPDRPEVAVDAPSSAEADGVTHAAGEPVAPVPWAEAPFAEALPAEAVSEFTPAEVASLEAATAHAPPEPMTLRDADAAPAEFAPRDDGFVDLAIDAQSEDPLDAAPAPGVTAEVDDPDSFERAVQQAAREVPVLLDVVDPLDVPLPLRQLAAAPERDVPPALADVPAPARKARGPSPVTLVATRPTPAPDTWPDTQQAADNPPADAAPEASTVMATEPRAPRSRLLRMKEKGLFKNG